MPTVYLGARVVGVQSMMRKLLEGAPNAVTFKASRRIVGQRLAFDLCDADDASRTHNPLVDGWIQLERFHDAAGVDETMQRVPFIAEGAIVPRSCNLQDVRLILRLAVACLAFRPSAKAGALVVFASGAQVAIIIPTLRTHADRPIGVRRRTTWSVVYHEVHTRARQPHELEGHEVDTRCNAATRGWRSMDQHNNFDLEPLLLVRSQISRSFWLWYS
jgi:hypothetical protein